MGSITYWDSPPLYLSPRMRSASLLTTHLSSTGFDAQQQTETDWFSSFTTPNTPAALELPYTALPPPIPNKTLTLNENARFYSRILKNNSVI